MRLLNTISGEIKTRKDWLEEIELEGYNVLNNRTLTPSQYLSELLEEKTIVEVRE